jgi:hypothetical protein
MKIAPLKVSDPWFGRITKDKSVHTDALSAVPIEATVEVELVELLHEGPEANYRPYLHLRGELTEVKPAVDLPYGVSELALRRGSGLPLDAFYAFTRDQLADLVTKGYFSPAFRVPEEMSGIPWTLPGKADFMIVAPEFADQAPIVFMAVAEQTGMELDESNSGYELSAYFPDYSAEAEAQAARAEHEADAPLTLEGRANEHDVFSDITRDQPRAAQAEQPLDSPADTDLRATVPDGVFSRLVEEIEARQKPAAPVVEIEDEAADEIAPSSFEEVYLSRVDPGVARVLSGEHVADEIEDEEEEQRNDALEQQTEAIESETETAEVATNAGAGELLLDLSEPEPEPEIASLNLQHRESVDEHRAAVECRAARLRAEAAGDAFSDEDDQQITL